MQFHGSQFSPAHIPEEGKAELAFGYKSLVGAFHNVSNYYFSASRVFRNPSGSAHVGRINFANDKDGPYISSPRVSINYAYKIRISEKTFLTAGLAFGGAGMFYSAPSSTVPDVYFPDGGLGLTLKWRNLTLGAASYQIFNASSGQGVTPVILHRYYQGFGSLYKDWYTGWRLSGTVLYRNLPFQYNQSWAGLSIDYRRHFVVGANMSLTGMLTGYAGWTAFIGEDRLTVSFAYNSTVINKMPIWQNNIELGLNYLIH